jgi:hypothetical protein
LDDDKEAGPDQHEADDNRDGDFEVPARCSRFGHVGHSSLLEREVENRIELRV